MTGTDLCVHKPLLVPVIFEPPCTWRKTFYSLFDRRMELYGAMVE